VVQLGDDQPFNELDYMNERLISLIKYELEIMLAKSARKVRCDKSQE
jgi:hypothetical protein